MLRFVRTSERISIELLHVLFARRFAELLFALRDSSSVSALMYNDVIKKGSKVPRAAPMLVFKRRSVLSTREYIYYTYMYSEQGQSMIYGPQEISQPA